MAECAGAVPSSGHHIAQAQTTLQNSGFHCGHIVVGFASRHRVLPNQVFMRHFGPDVTRFRAQVTVGQLEPGTGKHLGEIVWVFVKAL